MPRRWPALMLVAVVAAACTNDRGSQSVKDAKVVDPAAQRYAGSATVVETRDHGPEALCDRAGANQLWAALVLTAITALAFIPLVVEYRRPARHSGLWAPWGAVMLLTAVVGVVGMAMLD